MGDVTPAEETELGASSCQLFDSSMRNEARRLRTFQQWPDTSPVSARDLVRAGFFFVGPKDEVQCFCCGGVLKDWGPGDWPALEHLKSFPSCKFICGEDVGNQEMLRLQEIFDTVDGQFLSLLQGIDSEETALPSEPEYPEMETEEMRLSTFQNWPQYTDVRPEQLARAGFFYTGLNDIVRCFYCDGHVRNWSFGDDPWREHAKWYPGCEFLLRSRGREFIRSVQESFSSTLLSPRDSWDQTEQGSPAASDLLRNWQLRASPLNWLTRVWDVLDMDFPPMRVANLVENQSILIWTFDLSESELVSDLLQPDWGEGSSAEQNRDAVQRETETSSLREETQSVQQKKSDESRMSTEEQLRRLQEERMCKVCMDRDVSVVFVPCGHLVACGECALSLRLCPICRAVIQGSVRTFMS
ncbi:PREDICTED: baculoviral IAP repeat-containing protein 7 [Calidris pugnax]|uniref:baculoviral IAP repeat-containing protein 7 n=1 Tax=Calidris pugnax TaxID=198806 RepID=UPI00071C7789|nr:PREDICTED: baculoviral IAP repeat-containing protein 7 [Calidris pugnax]